MVPPVANNTADGVAEDRRVGSAADPEGIRLQFAATTDVGRARARNEDAFCAQDLVARPGAVLLAVADGLGGHPGGDVASRVAVHALSAHISVGAATALSWTDLLEAGFAAAHAAVRAAAAEQPELAGMATTLVAAVLIDDWLYWAHVGDSRLYVAGAAGMRQVTVDHSPVGDLVREGVLTWAEARVHPLRHMLSRAVGFESAVVPDAGAERLAAGEWVLLVTDGLTAVVPAEQIEAAARAAEEPDALARALVAMAMAAGGPDNVTVVVARVAGRESRAADGGGAGAPVQPVEPAGGGWGPSAGEHAGGHLAGTPGGSGGGM
jgi:serine/threonine protein phosphatase PrpC